MSIFDKVKKGRPTNAHGEVNFVLIEKGDVDLTGFEDVSPKDGHFVVGHSESGHHHLLEAEGVTMKRGAEAGMEVLYAIVKNPAVLRQEAAGPHEQQVVAPGKYIVTNNVEYNPWSDQARRVAD